MSTFTLNFAATLAIMRVKGDFHAIDRSKRANVYSQVCPFKLQISEFHEFSNIILNVLLDFGSNESLLLERVGRGDIKSYQELCQARAVYKVFDVRFDELKP